MSDITTITVPFGDLRSVTAPYLYRYDTDVYMQITGVAYLPDTCSVYFANTQSVTATEMLALIQEQDKTIKNLDARLIKLEESST